MYNRYVPGHDGTYRRQTITDTSVPCPKPELTPEPCEQKAEIAQQQRQPCRNASDGFDLGDLLLLCIVILLLIDSEEEDNLPLLIMAAAFLFLQ